jgi:hypothetical protein
MASSRGETVTFRVDGLSRVVAGLISLGLEVNDLKDAFSDIAKQGAVVAASYAPRRSGALAGDIRGNRAKSKAVITAGRVSVPYAGPINYGWAAHNIEPSGFMQKADAALQPFALQRLEANINAAITKRGLR